MNSDLKIIEILKSFHEEQGSDAIGNSDKNQRDFNKLKKGFFFLGWHIQYTKDKMKNGKRRFLETLHPLFFVFNIREIMELQTIIQESDSVLRDRFLALIQQQLTPYAKSESRLSGTYDDKKNELYSMQAYTVPKMFDRIEKKEDQIKFAFIKGQETKVSIVYDSDDHNKSLKHIQGTISSINGDPLESISINASDIPISKIQKIKIS